MTDELREALARIDDYLGARRLQNAILRQEDPGRIHECRGVPLLVDDLKTVRAAAQEGQQ